MIFHLEKERIRPFRIYGNLYFAGTRPASSHLLDTGDGLILIDPGYPQLFPLLTESIGKLGFELQDIRYILLSHGHYDHIGACRMLQKLSGAETLLGREDADYASGRLPGMTLAEDLGFSWGEEEQFEPDILLEDGAEIPLGNTRIFCRHTPGHTPGTFSFFFDLDGPCGRKRAGMFGGSGANTLTDSFLLRHPDYLPMRQAMLESIAELRKISVDIHVGNHVGNNQTLERGKLLLAGKQDAFVDPSDWDRHLTERQNKITGIISESRFSKDLPGLKLNHQETTKLT